jgi:hypothetical protein
VHVRILAKPVNLDVLIFFSSLQTNSSLIVERLKVQLALAAKLATLGREDKLFLIFITAISICLQTMPNSLSRRPIFVVFLVLEITLFRVFHHLAESLLFSLMLLE